MRFLRWLTAPVEAAAEPAAEAPARPPEIHDCGPWCATWTIAELNSLAATAPHECTHARRKVGRCARKRAV